ncbi:MAG: Tetratricopeptide repeat domain protein [Myxococcaceae bacterium]|nr:Tetratricopeptide repeat domain protein [Myxococcaceae bacterium]
MRWFFLNTSFALALAATGTRVRAQGAEVSLLARDAGADVVLATNKAASDSRGVETPARMLAIDLALLTKKRLAEKPATSVDELSELLEDAHHRVLGGRKDEATMLLLEAVEGPRFRAFETFDTFAAADLMLASLLLDQHALLSAERSVARLLARGTDSATFGPAYRRAVDIALVRGDYAVAAEQLREQVKPPLPEDAANELHYLSALAAYDAKNDSEAQSELTAITKKSRFYARAQYLLGAIAARRQQYEEATARFCAVRAIQTGAPRTRYESAALYPTEDLATLGMGRVAHEQGRAKEAFEHYFQVPNDSPLIAEALFESAYASYEQGHPRTALDSLEQLEARYPESPYTAEARVLRGYVHLASCDFERAERELVDFEGTFGGVLRELSSTLKSPASTHSLFVERAAAGDAGKPKRESLLLGLVTRDPEVERLRAELAGLDAELARSSRVGAQFGALAERVRGKEAPHALSADERGSADQGSDAQRIAELRTRTSDLHAAIAWLASDLTKLRRGGAKGEELEELSGTTRKLRQRVDALEAELRQLLRKSEHTHAPPSGMDLTERLAQEAAYVDGVRSRAFRIRDQLEGELASAERRALEVLQTRLEKELRRARIGRIDAVMGKKRKLELEVESLSAGRFPAELSLSHQKPALLSDDQEYWPFEGEDWSDEFQETR